MPPRQRQRHIGAVIDAELVNAFRAICAQQGLNGKEALTYLLRRVVDGSIQLPARDAAPADED